VFDATSARAHLANAAALAPYGKRLVDLTPAATGPYVVPAVNLSHLDAPDVNMVTCGGQATVPIVAAVSRVTPAVPYAEIVASIASRSAGPGTRANIDKFTETTASAIERVGGARHGKAIIILNPAEPPLIMRDTVFCLVGDAAGPSTRTRYARAWRRWWPTSRRTCPATGSSRRSKLSPIAPGAPVHTLGAGGATTAVSVFLEVEGAAHYMPSYAGNLDIMTSAALRPAHRNRR